MADHPPRQNAGSSWDWWQDRVLLPVAAGLCLVLIVLVALQNSDEPAHRATTGRPLSAALAARLARISASANGRHANPPTQRLTPVRTPPPTKDSPPQVLYVGAEWCPYCAAVRWPLALALMRFGTLSGLRIGRSAGAPEAAPGTATLDFSRATYTSAYVRFRAVELQDRHHQPLQTLDSHALARLKRYDTKPYTQPPGAIPFLLIGQRFVQSGSPVDPMLFAGMDWSQVVDALGQPRSPLRTAVLASADAITRALCASTQGRPATTCAVYLHRGGESTTGALP